MWVAENEIDGSQAEAIIDELNKPDGLIGREATVNAAPATSTHYRRTIF